MNSQFTDAQKDYARSCVNVEVRFGRMPRPNALPCKDCGHVWAPGERRHEYDHPRGYGSDDIFDVEPVCTLCHVKRDSPKVRQTHCFNGHEFTVRNTARRANGTRKCRACDAIRQRNRRLANKMCGLAVAA